MMKSSSTSAWDDLLNNRFALVGRWIRSNVARAAANRAKAGDVNACAALARAQDMNSDPAVREIARDALLNCRSTYCMDAAWQVWASFRGKYLAETLIQTKRPAKSPSAVRALSLLVLQDNGVLSSPSVDLVEPLFSACSDVDPLISSRARYALAQFKNPSAISALCVLWCETRSLLLENTLLQAGYQPETPVTVRVLVALKFNRLGRVTHSTAEIIRPLFAACEDVDSEIRERARFCLLNLQNPEAIDELCAIWARERGDLPAQAVIQARYVARHPTPVRILSALKSGRIEVAENVSREGLTALLSTAADGDTQIAKAANQALRNLALPDTREKVCDLVIDEDHALAKIIALDAGYLPRQPERRALFLFLTEQWTAYETVDFDQRLLNSLYTVTSNHLRQRIMRKIQQTGRTDFLTILAGSGLHSRAAMLTPIESQLLVRMLANNHEWAKLWLLVKELDLAACKDALEILAANGFVPDHPDEQAIFNLFSALAAMPLAITADELRLLLPHAVPRATLKLNGRVNDVAFTPGRTCLALALGSGRVVTWDYQAARIETIYRNFAHSVSKVAYSSAGQLIAAERSSQDSACGLYLLENSHSQRFGQHRASITALDVLPDGRIFTASRDSTIALWDLSTRQMVNSRNVAGWARKVCISPNASTAILLKQSLDAVLLDSLQPLPGSQRRTNLRNGVYRAAAVLSDDLDVLAGMYNGELYAISLDRASPPPRRIGKQRGAFVGIQVLARHRLALTASAGAELHFYSLPDFQQVSSPSIPSNRLTSLEISTDGSFMATGVDDSSMVLWDLRLLDLPEMFTRPLAALRPSQMEIVNSLLQIDTLPTPVQNALNFYRALLQYRFAYDIHIVEAEGIRAGEFDVLID